MKSTELNVLLISLELEPTFAAARQDFAPKLDCFVCLFLTDLQAKTLILRVSLGWRVFLFQHAECNLNFILFKLNFASHFVTVFQYWNVPDWCPERSLHSDGMFIQLVYLFMQFMKKFLKIIFVSILFRHKIIGKVLRYITKEWPIKTFTGKIYTQAWQQIVWDPYVRGVFVN